MISNFIRTIGFGISALTLLATVGCSAPIDPEKQLASAQGTYQEGNVATAVIELKNLLARNPDYAEARYLLGIVYLDSENFAGAEVELRRALKLGIEPGKVLPPLGKALNSQGKFKDTLAETDPGHVVPTPEINGVRGLAQVAAGNFAEAKRLFERSLSVRPNNTDALLGLALLAGNEKRLDEGTRLIERAIGIAPKSVDSWLLKGDLRHAASDHAGAVAAYQKVLELKPENAPARLKIASLQVAQGNLEEAQKQVREVLKRSPNTPMANYLQALIEFQKKDYPKARDAILQVRKVLPDYLLGIRLAGAIGYELGDYAQAQADLARVIQESPRDLRARKLLIASLMKGGHTARAMEVLQPALKQAPEDAELSGLAGQLYTQNNEFSKAAGFFERAAKLDPKSATARAQLALNRLVLGEADRALNDLESAAKLDSQGYQMDVALVLSHLRRRSYDKAFNALANLEKKQPNNPDTYNLKAAIYIDKGDIASARKYLGHALELQPTYVPAAMNLARLDLQDNNPRAARRRLELILEKEKDNKQALLSLAELGPRIGATLKEQIDWLERATKGSAELIQSRLMLARLYAQAGDRKKALDMAQQVQARGSDDPEILISLGNVHMAAGDWNQAVSTFDKLVGLQPKSPVALYYLGSAQAAIAKQDLAINTLRKAVALKPDYTDAQVALLQLQIRTGDFLGALKIAQQIQKKPATAALGLSLEGDVWLRQKKFDQAAKAYDTAYGMAKDGQLAIKLHVAYSQAGKLQEAQARLADWLKQSPDDDAARAYAAEAALTSENYQYAIEQYEWLLRKRPDNILILNNLAWAYYRVQDTRALDIAERAFKAQPDNPSAADTLGWILVERGNTARGLDLLKKAVTAAPETLPIRYHLAQALARSGDKAQAIAQLERVVGAGSKFPQQAEALALLKRLRGE